MQIKDQDHHQDQPSSTRLQDKLKQLIAKKLLNIKLVKTPQPEYKYADLTEEDLFDLSKKKMVDIGQKCKGIVVRKDQTTKELHIHLTKIILPDAESKYLASDRPGKPRHPQQAFIHHQKQMAFIKDYDIKQPFSIFTYINSYKDIKIGSEVFGVLVRKEKRSLSGSQVGAQNNENNVWFEISVKNQPPKSFPKLSLPTFGISYDQRFSEVVDANYQKTSTFSISKLALYTDNFQNNDIIPKLKQSLDIELNQNINPISNIRALKHMHIRFERLIFVIKQDSVGSGKTVGERSLYGGYGVFKTRQQPVRD